MFHITTQWWHILVKFLSVVVNLCALTEPWLAIRINSFENLEERQKIPQVNMTSHWLITPSHPGGLSYLGWSLAVVLLLTDFGK